MKDGAWLQRQDVGFDDIIRFVENHLQLAIETRSRGDVDALRELLLSTKITLYETIHQLHDYVQDLSYIPFWEERIELIEGIIRRDNPTGQALAELSNQLTYFHWRIDETDQIVKHGHLDRQRQNLDRLGIKLATCDFEPEIQTFQKNWEFLESSGDGLEQIIAYNDVVAKDIKDLRDDDRFKFLYDYLRNYGKLPDKRYIGKSGFKGYVVLSFAQANVAILESAFVGNALYKMPADQWEELSKLSKTELLESHRSDVHRFLHSTTGWRETLCKLLIEWDIIG